MRKQRNIFFFIRNAEKPQAVPSSTSGSRRAASLTFSKVTARLYSGPNMRAEVEVALPVRFKHRVPVHPLSRFVEVLWYWSGYSSIRARERLLPMGTVELVVRLDSPRPADSGISGPRSEPLILDRGHWDETLGVHFKAGGAFPFLNFPFGDLHNASVSLADLWGESRASRLLCLLHEARTIDRKLQVMEGWLLQ